MQSPDIPEHDESGQMAVEVAVITPVLLIVLVIVIDMLVFADACARFDHVASQCALASSTRDGSEDSSPEARTESILAKLEESFDGDRATVQVTWEDAGVPLSSMTRYTCTLLYAPWPLSGAGAPSLLEHSMSIVIDPYTPGELL